MENSLQLLCVSKKFKLSGLLINTTFFYEASPKSEILGEGLEYFLNASDNSVIFYSKAFFLLLFQKKIFNAFSIIQQSILATCTVQSRARPR